MKYLAMIQFLDTGDIQEVTLKVGDMEEGKDDDVFFFFDSDKDLESFRKEGVHDWVILSVSPEGIDLDHMITSAKDALETSDNLTEKEYEYLVRVLENLRS
jgi:hypothetical protein